MIYRRIIAVIIDILIAGVAAIIVGLYLNSSIQNILFKTVLFYFLHTTLILFLSKKYTFGEGIIKIRAVSIDSKDLQFTTLFLRNILFCFYLLLIAICWGRPFEFILFVLLFLSLNSIIFIKNNYHHPMTGFDFLFKSYYISLKTT
ncbi:MAG: RDD family protein [Syntrophorhabdus sp. PtaB.Bin027]|nr:MAG: RDD family protein [Syntrophorhabdus sp. PtaB.Bin027]